MLVSGGPVSSRFASLFQNKQQKEGWIAEERENWFWPFLRFLYVRQV
jgi:hypothetical protein